MRQPNLFIMGAPKCGTTTLYHWLAKNPSIGAPRAKEPHYYYSPYGPPLDRDTYLSLYADLPDDCTHILDSSVWYLFSQSAVDGILEEVPDAKFIVCLRNPVEMSPSLHYQKLFSTHETVHSFKEALKLNEKRAAGSFEGITNLPETADPRHMAYVDACLLGEQVESLLGKVDPKRVQFCLMEDMAATPEAVYNRICDFIGIEASPIEFSVTNRAKRLRNRRLQTVLDVAKGMKRALGIKKRTGALAWLHKINRDETRYAEPDQETKLMLANAFRDDIRTLERSLGRDLSHWLEPLETTANTSRA